MTTPTTYIDRARQRLAACTSGLDPELLDLYALLVLTKGTATTLADIHDAWSLWRSRTRPDHPFLVPFEELSAEVQELDRRYAEAVAGAAARLHLERTADRVADLVDE